jgi:hypothetical protein
MSGVLPEGTDVGYYIGGKVYFFLSGYATSCNIIVINTVTDNFLEVAGWVHKGARNLLSLLQFSGKFYSCLSLDTYINSIKKKQPGFLV